MYECRDISRIRILVPGAGLGRMTYELAYRGYYCEGNEFSLFMLVASNFVLNRCVVENQYTIYPWVSQTNSLILFLFRVSLFIFFLIRLHRLNLWEFCQMMHQIEISSVVGFSLYDHFQNVVNICRF